MALMAQATFAEVERLAESLTHEMRSMGSLENAARRFVERLRERFPSIVLARVFGTVPSAQLPPQERAAADAAAGAALFPRTEVLTLFATAGTRPEWNDRHRSRAHLAIPLVSRAHVDGIPMVARLLDDLRYRIDGDPAYSAPYVTRAFANANGLFYVPDPAITVDDKGRRVIPAVDFVREHSIGTVFGFGGSYVIRPMFVSTIIFTQERLAKESAMNFLQLSSAFKAGTTRFTNRGLLFETEEPAWGNG